MATPHKIEDAKKKKTNPTIKPNEEDGDRSARRM